MEIHISASFDPHVVLIEPLDGKGVIVGDKILTACHCIPLDFDRELTLQTHSTVKLRFMSGKSFHANIEFADPISDVAILGAPDAQTFSDGAGSYGGCVSYSPIEVCFDDLPSDFAVQIRNRDGSWVSGIAELFPNHRIFVDTEKEILYICQPNRSFRNVKRIGFYSRGNIYPLVPLILDKQDDVLFERSAHDGPLGELVDQILNSDESRTGQRHMVFFLSAPDSDDTLDLGQNIPNNKKSRTGKNTAFTMRQRYVSTDALVAAKKTSDLD